MLGKGLLILFVIYFSGCGLIGNVKIVVDRIECCFVWSGGYLLVNLVVDGVNYCVVGGNLWVGSGFFLLGW